MTTVEVTFKNTQAEADLYRTDCGTIDSTVDTLTVTTPLSIAQTATPKVISDQVEGNPTAVTTSSVTFALGFPGSGTYDFYVSAWVEGRTRYAALRYTVQETVVTPKVRVELECAEAPTASVSIEYLAMFPTIDNTGTLTLVAGDTYEMVEVGSITQGATGSIRIRLQTSEYEVTGVTWEGTAVTGTTVGAYVDYTNLTNTSADGSALKVTVRKKSTPVPTYTITPSVGTGGTISPSTARTVSEGGTQQFTVRANTGYRISAVYVDNVDVGGDGYTAFTYKFTNVTADHTIRGEFYEESSTTYTITASAGAGGTITPSGAVSVPEGEDQTFTIEANQGYTIQQILVDGEPITL